MYYARKTQGSTRLIGIVIAIVVNLVVGYVLVTGLGEVIVKKIVDTQVVIIEKPKVEDKEPPPPPPVDVDLPPPPPVLTQRPTVRRNSPLPDYPPASRRAKEEGVVSLTLCVDASGKVSKSELRKSSGFPRLDEAALDWVKNQRLNPAMQGKTPVAICDYPLDYQFQLKDAN
jgi:protein TonB